MFGSGEFSCTSLKISRSFQRFLNFYDNLNVSKYFTDNKLWKVSVSYLFAPISIFTVTHSFQEFFRKNSYFIFAFLSFSVRECLLPHNSTLFIPFSCVFQRLMGGQILSMQHVRFWAFMLMKVMKEFSILSGFIKKTRGRR